MQLQASVVLTSLWMASVAWAAPPPADSATDDAQREAEMFGSTPAPAPAPASADTANELPLVDVPRGASGHDVAFDNDDGTAPLGAPSPAGGGLQALADQVNAHNNVLTVGGFFFLRAEYDVVDEGTWDSNPITSPNLMDLYFDARPSERIRGYFRGRATYNPSVANGQLDPLSFQPVQQTMLLLDQFWLKFDLARVAFFTIGRQPIRWGTGRFWNPTDFLNLRHRDPLAIFDQRVGVTLARIDFPLETLGWNLYAVLNATNAKDVSDLGGALRAEVLVDQTEISFTAYSHKDGPLQFGLDVSSGVGMVDLRLEAAATHGTDQVFFHNDANIDAGKPPTPYTQPDTWLFQAVAGVETSLRYNDSDSVILGVEYFYNQLGYPTSDDYLFAVVSFAQDGQAPPFLYLGQHYLAAYVNLTKPGSWDDSMFTLSFIGNLSDDSFITRFDWQARVLTFMDFNFWASGEYGKDGELRFTVPSNAATLLQNYFHLPSPPSSAAQLSSVKVPRVQVGMGLRLYF